MNMKYAVSIICASVGLLAASGAQAYTTYSGVDPNPTNSNNVPLAVTPNSNAAEANFLSQLTGVGTETFETKSGSAPLALNFPGAGTATLNGAGAVVSVTPGTTNGFGRYSVPSATSSRYWEVNAGGSGTFNVTFSSQIAAFGFYGIDIGDFAGTLEIDLFSDVLGNNLIGSLPVTTAPQNTANGSVLYLGFIAANPGELFQRVAFRSTSGNSDVFAFDNFTIGSKEQVCRENCPVPEPGTLALFSLGLLGFGLTRRRKTT
jgi:hypothetical protein